MPKTGRPKVAADGRAFRFRALRKLLGLRQEDVSALANLPNFPYQTVTKVEGGDNKMTGVDTLRGFSAAYGLSLERLNDFILGTVPLVDMVNECGARMRPLDAHETIYDRVREAFDVVLDPSELDEIMKWRPSRGEADPFRELIAHAESIRAGRLPGGEKLDAPEERTMAARAAAKRSGR